MPTYTLNESASVTLDADGAGQTRIGPQRHGEKWTIRRISLQCTGQARPAARVYRDTPAPSAFVAGTYNATQNTDDGIDEDLYPGQSLVIAWTVGDAGATATATFRGERTIGGT